MRKVLRNISTRARRFSADRRGSMAVAFGAVSVVLMMGAGFALDTGQMLMTKSNLLNALDSAVTSTARDLTTGAIAEEDARENVEAFLFSNGGTGFADADQIKLDSLDVDRTKKTVSAQASVDIAMVFPFFRNDPVQHIVVQSASVYSDKHIEVAMMLDVTGSMYSDPDGRRNYKIDALKTAAKNAVEQLFDGQKQENPRVRVSIVPYAEAVNVGAALAERAVFVEKAGGPDLPPSFADPIQVSATVAPDNCATERKLRDGSADFNDDGPDAPRLDDAGKPYYAKVNRDDRISLVENRRHQVIGTMCPSAEVVPLTTDKERLLDSIDAFNADGVTAGAIAAQWGYYMLSPDWRPTIASAGLGEGPANYHDKKVAKVAILMTDGLFNTAFAAVPPGQQPQNVQANRANANAEAICRNMKSDGIEVYTIGFDLDNRSIRASERRDAKTLLGDCASPDTGSLKHFYQAADAEELDETFKQIIANLEALHLTK